MFFERVPVTPVIGATPSEIFDQYGIDQARFREIINLPQNEPLRKAAGSPIQLHTQLPGLAAICLPIDFDVKVVVAVPRVDMVKGLRPTPLLASVAAMKAAIAPFTHGVHIEVERSGRVCKRVRWLQTVTKRNNPDPLAPPKFVDSGDGNGLPWYYNGDTNPEMLRFDDTPCGPEAPAMGRGVEFVATVSVALWTMERITLVKGFTYGFGVGLGKSITAIRWNPVIRAATDAEMAEQVRILVGGINTFRKPTGGRLVYQLPPANGAISDGILFGRF